MLLLRKLTGKGIGKKVFIWHGWKLSSWEVKRLAFSGRPL